MQMFIAKEEMKNVDKVITLNELQQYNISYFNAIKAFNNDFPEMTFKQAKEEFDKLFFNATFTLEGQVFEF